MSCFFPFHYTIHRFLPNYTINFYVILSPDCKNDALVVKQLIPIREHCAMRAEHWKTASSLLPTPSFQIDRRRHVGGTVTMHLHLPHGEQETKCNEGSQSYECRSICLAAKGGVAHTNARHQGRQGKKGQK